MVIVLIMVGAAFSDTFDQVFSYFSIIHLNVLWCLNNMLILHCVFLLFSQGETGIVTSCLPTWTTNLVCKKGSCICFVQVDTLLAVSILPSFSMGGGGGQV